MPLVLHGVSARRMGTFFVLGPKAAASKNPTLWRRTEVIVYGLHQKLTILLLTPHL